MGRGVLPTAEAALALERDVLAPFDALKAGLEAAGLAQDRRALRLLPAHLQWRWRDAHTLQIGFDLPPGCYATVVLRELADTAQPCATVAAGAWARGPPSRACDTARPAGALVDFRP